MTGAERGFLLLSSHMGDPARKVLTAAQLRTLADRAACISFEDRDLTMEDVLRLGYNREMAARIAELLSEEERLNHYLRLGKRRGCVPVPRSGADYPGILLSRLGWDAPGCLWVRGDAALLDTPAISLVGSRELREPNRAFAQAVGRMAAEQGLTLVSGNARGADRMAQEACLEAGGQVISIVADELSRQRLRERVLYLSEDSFDLPFTAHRALSRNRCIHAMGRIVFVAQSEHGKGGTWNGTTQNLRHGWSPVLCFDDGSEAVRALEALGAGAIGVEELGLYQVPKEYLPMF